MKRKSKLDAGPVKKKVANMVVAGISQKKIGKEFGVDQSVISKFCQKDDVKVLIRAEQEKLMEAIPDAVENLTTLVLQMKKINWDKPLDKEDMAKAQMYYKASTDVLKAVGILPSPVNARIAIENNPTQHSDTYREFTN